MTFALCAPAKNYVTCIHNLSRKILSKVGSTSDDWILVMTKGCTGMRSFSKRTISQEIGRWDPRVPMITSDLQWYPCYVLGHYK